MRAKRLTSLLATVAVLAAAGCGGSGDDDRASAPEIRKAYAALSRDLASGRLEAACASMTKRAARYLGSLAHGRPRSCEQDLRRFFRLTRAKPATLTPPRASEVRVDGDRASVIARDDGGWTVRVPFVREGDEWRANNIIGTTAPPTPDVS